MNENNITTEKFSKNKAVLDGENAELILKQHLFFENFSTRDLIKMIGRIRSFEKGLIKRNLTEKEIALKEEILKSGRSLRWTEDLLRLTILPSDLKWMIENKQIRISEALKEFSRRKEQNLEKNSLTA